MNGIYIKGMPFPTEGRETLRIDSDGEVNVFRMYRENRYRAYAVSGHGPLVDRDDICIAFHNLRKQRELEGRDVTFEDAVKLISIAPPVIPADGEEGA